MAYYVDRTVKMTWWERSYLPEILRGMYITSRHFFVNLFGFVPFFLGQKLQLPSSSTTSWHSGHVGLPEADNSLV